MTDGTPGIGGTSWGVQVLVVGATRSYTFWFPSQQARTRWLVDNAECAIVKMFDPESEAEQ